MHLLNSETIRKSLSNNQLDFLLINPYLLEILRHENSLTGSAASLVRSYKGIRTSNMGGVIFVPSEKSNFYELRDLQHAKIAIPNKYSSGGYLIPLSELQQSGIDIAKIDTIETVTNRGVVEAVLAGKADAGFVRTGALEDLFQKGVIQSEKIRIWKIVN